MICCRKLIWRHSHWSRAAIILYLIVSSALCPKLLSLENSSKVIWNLKSSFEIWKFDFNLKFFIASKNLFQIWTLKDGAMCVYSFLSCDKIEYTHIAPLSTVHIWNFQTGYFFQTWIWNLKEIQFSRYWSFGY